MGVGRGCVKQTAVGGSAVCVILGADDAAWRECLDDAGVSLMGDVTSLNRAPDDTLWAVVASVGKTHRVAEVYASRMAALADRRWREQQVRSYEAFLRNARQPVPYYSVAPIRRADLPRKWKPLPALGFLRGQLV